MIANADFDRNPIHDLYHSKLPLIAKTRVAVLKEVRKVSPCLAVSAERILDKKMGEHLPPLGEMLPWVLGELSEVSVETLNRLAKGWLAIYLYGHLLDDRSDRDEHLTSEEQLLCWILFQQGLRNLHSLTFGTDFEHQFEHYLASAVRYQLHDLSDRGSRLSNRRAKYSTGKNHCLVACAAAVAASSRRENSHVVRFMLRLLPCIQHLDDIADLDEDAKQGNYTQLLAKAMGRRRRDLAKCDESEIVEHAVRSGALEEVLRAARRALLAAKNALGSHQWLAIRQTPSGVFFDRLSDAVAHVTIDVRAARHRLLSDMSDPRMRRHLIRDVRRKLEVVAQGS